MVRNRNPNPQQDHRPPLRHPPGIIPTEPHSTTPASLQYTPPFTASGPSPLPSVEHRTAHRPNPDLPVLSQPHSVEGRLESLSAPVPSLPCTAPPPRASIRKILTQLTRFLKTLYRNPPTPSMDPKEETSPTPMLHSSLYGHLPALLPEGTNFHIWRQAFIDFPVISAAQHTPDPTYTSPLQDLVQHAKYIEHCASLHMLVTNRLSKGLAETTDLTCDSSPADLLAAIETRITDSSPATHLLLRQEADRLRRTPYTTVDEYIKKRRTLRMRKRLAQYPNISIDETVTVDAVIKGLKHHPTFEYLSETWAETMSVPSSIQTIQKRLNAVQDRTIARQAKISPNPRGFLTANPCQVQLEPNPRPRGRTRGRTHPRGQFYNILWTIPMLGYSKYPT